jgi:hypothetical protein
MTRKQKETNGGDYFQCYKTVWVDGAQRPQTINPNVAVAQGKAASKSCGTGKAVQVDFRDGADPKIFPFQRRQRRNRKNEKKYTDGKKPFRGLDEVNYVYIIRLSAWRRICL